MKTNTIHQGDALSVLRNFPANSVDCVVTSPPYYCLRDYGVDGQIGLEQTPELYIERLTKVFEEVRRILKKEGTCWINIADSYWGGKGSSSRLDATTATRRKESGETFNAPHIPAGGYGKPLPTDLKHPFIKSKDLIGIPWMLAFSLRNSGWFLRQEIIWHKPNAMPESVTDRCTSAYESLFLFTKSAHYHFDAKAIMEPANESWNGQGFVRNRRNVWTYSPAHVQGHHAAFPTKLVRDCILAGSPDTGIVLDPFLGSGTTAVVAAKIGRRYVGIELNASYIALAERRLHSELGLFNTAR